MKTDEQIRTSILDRVAEATRRRVRPFALGKFVRRETGVSMGRVRAALNVLMREKRLVFTYRDPCSYVEIPPSESRP